MEPLRPRTLGELIDWAATVWRKEWRALFVLSLGFQLVNYLLSKSVQLAMARSTLATSQATFQARLESELATVAKELAPLMLMSFVFFALIFIVSAWSSQASCAYLAPRMMGLESPTIEDTLKRLKKQLGISSALTLLSLAWGTVVGLALSAPGAIALFFGFQLARQRESALLGAALLVGGFLVLMGAWIVSLVAVILRFLFVAPIIALESGGVWAIFKRAGALTQGTIGPGVLGLVKVRLTIIITVVSIVMMIVTSLAGLPQLVLSIVYNEPTRSMMALAPQYLLVPAELLNTLAWSLFGPIYAALQLGTYLDMRVRREGLDLTMRMGGGEDAGAAETG